jgi:hypothetical protein
VTDEEFVAEIRRRLADDNGVRITLDEVLRRSGISREELEADEADP